MKSRNLAESASALAVLAALTWTGRSFAEATVVPGSWDVAGLRGTGSFDWTVKDVFLPERRTCPRPC